MVGGDSRLSSVFTGGIDIVFVQFFNFDEPQNAVERRADVMAHAGEKGRFGRIGGECLVLLYSGSLQGPG